jgi:hypothetical protein
VLRYTLILSEEYEITVYESYASVYCGYASYGEVKNIYYSVPTEIIVKLTQYLQEMEK